MEFDAVARSLTSSISGFPPARTHDWERLSLTSSHHHFTTTKTGGKAVLEYISRIGNVASAPYTFCLLAPRRASISFTARGIAVPVLGKGIHYTACLAQSCSQTLGDSTLYIGCDEFARQETIR